MRTQMVHPMLRMGRGTFPIIALQFFAFPFPAEPYQPFYSVFLSISYRLLFISLSTIFIGQELPEEIDVKISEKGETI